MAVPDFQAMMLPLMKLASDGQPHSLAEAVEWMAHQFRLSGDDQAELIPSGQPRLYNRVGWTATHLRKAGLLRAVGPGRFELTERGRDVLASRPAALNAAFLESQFPEYSEFRRVRSYPEANDEDSSAIFNTSDGTWKQRANVEERVRKTLELSIPDEETRCAALRLFGARN
jgi:restriction system protein